MGDWNISRKRYFGLPLPFYPCECGQLNVIGSREELEERATAGSTSSRNCTGPGSTRSRSRASRGETSAASPRSATRGWTRASSPSRRSAGRTRSGSRARVRNRRLEGPDRRRPAGPRVLGALVPGATGSRRCREQIRLWFYSMLFMSVTLDGRAPYERVLAYEQLLDENGREMHKSTGNAIEADEALDGWAPTSCAGMFCEQVPSQNLNFGYGPAGEIKRRLLTLWNSVKFFVDYANIQVPPRRRGPRRARAARPLAARAHRAARCGDDGGVRALLDAGRDPVVRVVRRRSLELVHPPLAAAVLGWRRGSVVDAVARARAVAADDRAGDAVSGGSSLAHRCGPMTQPESIFLPLWPEVRRADEQLLAEVAEMRRIVELGRQARGELAAEAAPAAPAARRAGRGAARGACRRDRARSCA